MSENTRTLANILNGEAYRLHELLRDARKRTSAIKGVMSTLHDVVRTLQGANGESEDAVLRNVELTIASIRLELLPWEHERDVQNLIEALRRVREESRLMRLEARLEED